MIKFNLLMLATLDCQYQYLQEPLSKLYCSPSQQDILIGCSVVYPIDAPRVELVFFQDNTLLTNHFINNIQTQTNNTHHLITRTVSVQTLDLPAHYRCFPQFSNGSFLLPSQALYVSTSPMFPSCFTNNDVFSTYTTRCADLDFQQTPDDMSNAVTTVTTSTIEYQSMLRSMTSTLKPTSTVRPTDTTIVSETPLLSSVVLPIFSVMLTVIVAQSIVILGLCCKYRRVHKLKVKESLNSNPYDDMHVIQRHSTQSYATTDPSAAYYIAWDLVESTTNVEQLPQCESAPETMPNSSSDLEQDAVYAEIVGTPPPSAADPVLPPGYSHLLTEQLDGPHPYTSLSLSFSCS